MANAGEVGQVISNCPFPTVCLPGTTLQLCFVLASSLFSALCITIAKVLSRNFHSFFSYTANKGFDVFNSGGLNKPYLVCHSSQKKLNLLEKKRYFLQSVDPSKNFVLGKNIKNRRIPKKQASASVSFIPSQDKSLASIIMKCFSRHTGSGFNFMPFSLTCIRGR